MILKSFRHLYDAAKALAQVETHAGRVRGNVEVVDGYGLAVNPPEGLNDLIVAQLADCFHLGLAWHDENRPSDLQPGEVLLYNRTGAGETRIFLRLDGSVEILPANGKLKIVADIEHEGMMTSTGDHVAGGISLMTHTHGGVIPGGANTTGPN